MSTQFPADDEECYGECVEGLGDVSRYSLREKGRTYNCSANREEYPWWEQP